MVSLLHRATINDPCLYSSGYALDYIVPKQNIVLVCFHQYACVSDSDAAHLTDRVHCTQIVSEIYMR